MAILIKLMDKRYGHGFKNLFFHDEQITPEIYKLVKIKQNKVLHISDANGKYYYRNGKPTISDFLNDYSDLDE